MNFITNQTYVCLGSCQAQISEEEYNKGLTACGNDACENRGKPFAEGSKCVTCGKNFAEGQKHQHQII